MRRGPGKPFLPAALVVAVDVVAAGALAVLVVGLAEGLAGDMGGVASVDLAAPAVQVKTTNPYGHFENTQGDGTPISRSGSTLDLRMRQASSLVAQRRKTDPGHDRPTETRVMVILGHGILAVAPHNLGTGAG